MIPIRTTFATLAIFCVVILAGCSTTSRTKGGGYYKDDGPGANIPSQLDSIPDAIPRIETHAPSTLRPYVVFGKRYVPLSDERPFRQEGTASWYGKKFHGNKTANGEKYDMYAMTAAHPTLPLPSYARVTHAGTGKSVIVRINDRGPFHSKRVMDLSYAAAAKLGLIAPGSGQVIVEAITNADIARGEIQPQPAPKPTLVASAAPIATPRPVFVTTPDALAAVKTEIALAPAPAPTQQPAAQAGQVFLQFGAFSESQNAQHLAQKLNLQIASVEKRSAYVQADQQLHRVQIGPYPSRTEAVNASLRIQQETGLQPKIALR
jgi:rare lipoprotein A